ncbi:MAG: hypothetical protein ACJAT4_002676 [Granulosicoccus sp.]|jgi:hypothetical protein
MRVGEIIRICSVDDGRLTATTLTAKKLDSEETVSVTAINRPSSTDFLTFYLR